MKYILILPFTLYVLSTLTIRSLWNYKLFEDDWNTFWSYSIIFILSTSRLKSLKLSQLMKLWIYFIEILIIISIVFVCQNNILYY